MYAPSVDSGQGLLASIAPVNTRLYGQLIAQGRPEHELRDIRRAYDLCSLLYAGMFQADGRPFSAHTVSVASIVAQLGLPSPIVAMALIHNVYENADFGDGLRSAITPARRRRVLDAVGADIEACALRFSELRIHKRPASVATTLDTLSARDRMLLLVDLADILEKYADMGLLYFGDSDWATSFVDAHEGALIQLCTALGQPVLAEALALAIARLRAGQVPAVLRSAGEHKYLYPIVPLSCRATTRDRWVARLRQSTAWHLARRILRGATA
jgi:hypothetical protein